MDTEKWKGHEKKKKKNEERRVAKEIRRVGKVECTVREGRG